MFIAWNGGMGFPQDNKRKMRKISQFLPYYEYELAWIHALADDFIVPID